MDELKLIEFKKALDMLNLIGPDIPKEQFERRKQTDRERDNKIKYFTDLLLSKKISVSTFLECMANKGIMPEENYGKY